MPGAMGLEPGSPVKQVRPKPCVILCAGYGDSSKSSAGRGFIDACLMNPVFLGNLASAGSDAPDKAEGVPHGQGAHHR